jgi:hypothetical protein
MATADVRFTVGPSYLLVYSPTPSSVDRLEVGVVDGGCPHPQLLIIGVARRKQKKVLLQPVVSQLDYLPFFDRFSCR